jgi:hypothetical protein
MRHKSCVDCGADISIYATRCASCRRIYRTQYERDRIAAEREKRQDRWNEHPGEYMTFPIGSATLPQEYDYTIPGAASKPPSFDIHRTLQKSAPDGEVIDYTHGGMSRPGGIYERSSLLDRVPGVVRRDFVKAHQMARDLAPRDDEPEVASWDQLGAQPADSRTVNFGRAVNGQVLRSEPGHQITNPAAAGQLYGAPVFHAAAVLGQAVTVARPRPPRPNLAAPQKTPAIIVN